MKRFLQASVGLAISGLALWFTLRGKDLGAIWRAAQGADYAWLVPYVGILAVIHLARTLRWGILLEPVAKVPFSRLNAVSAVGFMALMVLPFRIGEFARPYLIAERPRIRVSATLSSVVVERVADGLFTAALLVLTLLAVPEGTPGLHLLRVGGLAVFGAFAALLAFLVVAYRNRALAVRITHRLLDPLSPRLAAKVSGMMDAFIHGLRLVPSRSKVALFFALTAGYWLLNGWGMGILARAFGLYLTPVQSFTTLGVLVVGVMIPAGPGMVGTFQAATVLGLSLFLPQETLDTHGTAYANVLWAVQLAFTTLLGLFFLFSRHIRIAQIFSAPAEVEEGLEEEEKEYASAGDGAGTPERPAR
ncbi:MAG TPA: lysylphosphatidylglycerol synthase transmembrane domain-containing protein [Anaeromyxobacteraceae bacterium]|nr:lysylphosphatidylglycerol synthase transmembrane domain-containing protein [Anaeromyxobacteraceae bacterium]